MSATKKRPVQTQNALDAEERRKKYRRDKRELTRNDWDQTIDPYTTADAALERKLTNELFADIQEETPEKPAPSKTRKKVKREVPIKQEDDDDDDDDEEREPQSSDEGDVEPAAAWVDQDDEDLMIKTKSSEGSAFLKSESGAQYAENLKKRHVALVKQNTDWAKIAETSEFNEFAQSNETYILPDGRIPESHVSVFPLKAVNYVSPLQGVCQSASFHPNGQMVMLASSTSSIKFFQLSTRDNELVHHVQYKDFKLSSAQFMPDGSQVIVAGGKPFMYVYDLATGKSSIIKNVIGHLKTAFTRVTPSRDGKYIAVQAPKSPVMLFDGHSKQWVADLSAHANMSSVCAWSDDSAHLYVGYAGGRIAVWDVAQRKVVHSFDDVGVQTPTVLCFSPRGSYFLAGSASGIANIYNTKDVRAGGPKKPVPVKEIMALTTEVSVALFSHDEQVLVLGTNVAAKRTLKLVHLPSFHVFPNWPLDAAVGQSPVQNVCFSPQSGLLAIAGRKNLIDLYRMQQYPS